MNKLAKCEGYVDHFDSHCNCMGADSDRSLYFYIMIFITNQWQSEHSNILSVSQKDLEIKDRSVFDIPIFTEEFLNHSKGESRVLLSVYVFKENMIHGVCVCYSAWGWNASAEKDEHGVWGAKRGAAEACGEHALRRGASGRRRAAGTHAKQPPSATPGHPALGPHTQLLYCPPARWDTHTHMTELQKPPASWVQLSSLIHFSSICLNLFNDSFEPWPWNPMKF